MSSLIPCPLLPCAGDGELFSLFEPMDHQPANRSLSRARERVAAGRVRELLEHGLMSAKFYTSSRSKTRRRWRSARAPARIMSLIRSGFVAL